MIYQDDEPKVEETSESTPATESEATEAGAEDTEGESEASE